MAYADGSNPSDASHKGSTPFSGTITRAAAWKVEVTLRRLRLGRGDALRFPSFLETRTASGSARYQCNRSCCWRSLKPSQPE